MPQPIAQSITNHDLSSRFQGTSTVGASPAAGTETIIGTLALANFGDIPVVSGIRLHGWAAFTAGTSGVSATLKIRETNVSGTTVASTGAVTVTAANLYALDVLGLDAAPGVAVYVLTLTVGSGAAQSAVSALHLSATIIQADVSSVLGAELETSWFRGIISELHAAGLPLSARSNAYANALKVKSGPGILFGFSAYSSLATAQFIQVHDSAVAPASGAVPEAVFQVNSGATATGDYIAVSYIFPGRFFQRGIYVVNSTTGPTYTAGAADTFFDAQFAQMALAFNGKGGGGAAPFTGSIVRLSGSASQGTTTAVVPYDTVISDSDSFFSANDNGFIIPAGKGGIYEYGVTFSGTGTTGSTGFTLDLAVLVGNAPNCLYALGAAAASDSFGFGGSLIGKAPFADGDLVVCRTAAPGGSGVTIDGGNNDGMFWVTRLGNTP